MNCAVSVKAEFIADSKDSTACAKGDIAVTVFNCTCADGSCSVITCTEIKDAALNALVASLTEQLASLNAFVNIKDVTLAMQITDGRYDTILLNCNYVITVGDDVYTLNMSYASKFDYEREVLISAPVVE